jgi:signal transduction histidine kinase/ActR/RegA family two-component response regulator
MKGLSGRDAGRILALAAAYAVTAAVGLRLGATLHDTPPLWPAAGIAIAALCIGGVRLWPGVAIGTLIAVAPRGNGPVLTAAIVASTTLEAVIATVLLARVAGFRANLRRTRDAGALVIAAGLIAPAIGATVGAAAFALAESMAPGTFAHEWLDWFLGDAIGVVVFAPAVLVWTGSEHSSRRGLRITTTAIALLALAASGAAVAGVWVFGRESLQIGVLVQAYIAAAATTVLIVAASAAERGDALDRLMEKERQLSLVFDANSDTLLLFAVEEGDQFRLVTANDALRAQLRRHRPQAADAELTGITMDRFITDVLGVPSHCVAKAVGVFRSVVASRAPYSYENKDWNTDEISEVTLIPVIDRAGRCTHVLRSSRDISARKQAERSLREAELTRRALEAELFHAQKMEAIGTLAGGIAHDFNNILAAIVGNAEMAQGELPNGHPARQDLTEVLRAARRARELVLQILTFSRKQQPERRPVRTSDVVDDVRRLVRATIPSTIVLRSDISDTTLHVYGEPTQLHQVLMNLCTNAAHAIGDQHGEIELRQTLVEVGGEALHGDLTPGRYVCLTVRDTGHGMDRATLERAFEPFFTTKNPGVGTGLGLAVVNSIVKSHDGTVLVESTPGRGTTFQLYFPLLASHGAVGPARQSDVPRGDGERVLFVDDEPTLTSVAQRMLERLGYRVVALASSTEALAAFRADPSAFDVVISDLTMPGLTGTQLAVEMRRVRANMPVILSTGYLDRLDADTARAHARELLIKPYTTEDLASAVHRALTAAA